MNYHTVVSWDSSLADVVNANADNGTILKGLAVRALKITTGAPAAIAGRWLPGAIVQNLISGVVYRMSGSTAAPAWTAFT